MTSLGYEGGVVLPLELVARDAGRPIALRARVDLGVCSDICVPVTLEVAGRLSGGGRDARIEAALAAMPVRGAAMECEIEALDDGLRVRVETAPMPGAVAVIETGDPAVWASPPEVAHGARTRVTVDLVPPEAAPFALARSEVRLTLIGPDETRETIGCN